MLKTRQIVEGYRSGQSGTEIEAGLRLKYQPIYEGNDKGGRRAQSNDDGAKRFNQVSRTYFTIGGMPWRFASLIREQMQARRATIFLDFKF
jgi:hypothetical protein